MPAPLSAVHSPPPAPPPSASWLAEQGRLPLAFMGLALAWLAAGAILLLLNPDLPTFPHAHPHVVAVTHAWLLGFFLTVACGAVYQIAPVALGVALAKERLAWWHLGLHAVGVIGMVVSFWYWDMAQVGHFGTIVAIGVGLYTRVLWVTVRRAQRPGLIATSLLVSSVWLVLTVLMGLTFAANRFWYFLPVDPLPLLRMHAHAGLAGFFVTLLQGVSFQLVPMFTLGEVRDWRWATRGFWISQLALPALLLSLLLRSAWTASILGAVFLAGMLCSAIALRQVLATRKKRTFGPGVGAFLGGAALLLAAGGLGLALVWPGSQLGSEGGGFSAMVYGLLVVFGGLLPCFTGMMGKIVPFLTWMRAYGPRVGREPIPAASALGLTWVERAGLALQFLAVAPLAVGAWQLSSSWVFAGACVLTLGVGLFLVNQLWILRHLWRGPARARARMPETPPQPSSHDYTDY